VVVIVVVTVVIVVVVAVVVEATVDASLFRCRSGLGASGGQGATASRTRIALIDA
jgi:hypothetical protein